MARSSHFASARGRLVFAFLSLEITLQGLRLMHRLLWLNRMALLAEWVEKKSIAANQLLKPSAPSKG